MINTKNVCSLMLATMGLTACASLPNAQINYYLPTSEVTFEAITTVACDKNNKINAVTSPVIKTRSFADYDNARSIDLAQLDGAFNNSDIAVEWYDDGRLKNINATFEGQGEEILESVLSVAPVADGGRFLNYSDTQICEKINNEKTKTVSVTYQHPARMSSKTIGEIAEKTETSIKLHLSREGQKLKDQFQLGALVPPMWNAKFAHTYFNTNNVTSGDTVKKSNGIPIYLKNSMRVELSLLETATSKTIAGNEMVPVFMPKPTAFGRQAFSLALNENGSIAKIQYGNANGASDAFGSLGAVASVLSGPSNSDRLAAVKTEADLIEQQRRLLCLQTNSGDC